MHYYHTKDMIHRVSGAQVICNPFLEKAELRRPSALDDLIDLLGRVPIFGEDLRDWFESSNLLPQETNPQCKGLADHLILSKSVIEEEFWRPSSYQPPFKKSVTAKLSFTDNDSFHDPDEFRPINYSPTPPSSSIKFQSQSRDSNNLFNRSNFERFALKGKLKLQLRILRRVYENSSPVGLSSSCHSYIHRSFISANPTTSSW